MKVAIAGYGNLGRGVEAAVTNAPDMELVGIFTRRDPKSVRVATDTPLYMKTASGQKAKVTISRTGLNAKLQYTVTK